MSFQLLLPLISVLSLLLPVFAPLFSNRMRSVNASSTDCSRTLCPLGNADTAQDQNSLEPRKLFQREHHKNIFKSNIFLNFLFEIRLITSPKLCNIINKKSANGMKAFSLRSKMCLYQSLVLKIISGRSKSKWKQDV